MSAWLIEDEFQSGLAPLCDLRATFEQRTGGLTTLERMTSSMGSPPSGFLCEDNQRAKMISSRTGLPHVETGEPTSCANAPKTPWELLDLFPKLLEKDLQEAAVLGVKETAKSIGEYRIDIDDSAAIFPGVVLDATQGAIRIEAGAVVRPNAIVCGPCWIGKNTTIVDGTLLKPNTSIGPWCKIGGEVGGTIFQGYSNKCHEGHIGDSIIGEWVNFGAGTTNSNLLNTYGDVIVKDLNGDRHRTGRQFVGCFVGDHVKFSIQTRIMTGTIVGTGAMIASSGPAPSPTKRFSWITDSGIRDYNIDKCIAVMKIAMKRRNMTLDSNTEIVIRNLAEAK